jgi:ribose transport system substrate-binding protein
MRLAKGAPRCLAVLAVAVALALTGCSTGTEGSSGGSGVTGANLFRPGEGKISTNELRDHVHGSLKGKTLAYVPWGMGFPLTDQWGFVLKKRAEENGMNFVLRDPNFDSEREAQIVTALINQKPDVMVLHNPDVEVLAGQIEQAQKKGIYVIQINMVSNYKSDAYIGADWPSVGHMVADRIVKDCGPGTSGKVQIVEGPKTSAASLDQLAGAMEVFQKNPQIKIVSDQSGGNWEANKAAELTRTVLRAHPDLCAVYGFWDVMVQGSAQVVREQGMADKVKIYSEGDQSPVACQLFKDGLMQYDVAYSDSLQAQQMFDTASLLLQSGLKPGTVHIAHYSPVEEWTKGNVVDGDCYVTGKSLPR